MAEHRKVPERVPYTLMPPTYDYDGPGIHSVQKALNGCCHVKDGRQPDVGLAGFAFSLLRIAKMINVYCHGQMDEKKSPISTLFMRGGPYAHAASLLYDEKARAETLHELHEEPFAIEGTMSCCVRLMHLVERGMQEFYKQLPIQRLHRDLALLMFLYARWEWPEDAADEDPNPIPFWFNFIQPSFGNMADATYAAEHGDLSRVAALRSDDDCVIVQREYRRYKPGQMPRRKKVILNLRCRSFNERDLLTTRFSSDPEHCNLQIATLLLHYVVIRQSGDLENLEELFCNRQDLSSESRVLKFFAGDGPVRRALSIFHITASNTGTIGPLDAVETVREAICGVLAKFDHYNLPQNVMEAVDATDVAVSQYFKAATRRISGASDPQRGLDGEYYEICRALNELVVQIGLFEAEAGLRKKTGSAKLPRRKHAATSIPVEFMEQVKSRLDLLPRIYEQQLKSRGEHTILHNQAKTIGSRLTKIGKDVAIVRGETTGGEGNAAKPRGRKRQCPTMCRDALKLLIASKDKNVERIARQVFFDKKKHYKNRYENLGSFRTIVRRDWDDYAAQNPSA